MSTAPIPSDEELRLATLRELELLDSKEGERFGRITRLARRLFGVPLAAISLIDADREWFLSCDGAGAREGPRSESFCAHTLVEDATMVVNDAAEDPRFADNPLVRDTPSIRFYAGYPVRAPNGQPIGALSVRDYEPRSFDADQQGLLEDLAGWVEDEIRIASVARLEREVVDRTKAQRRVEKLYRKFIDLSIDLLCIADFNGYFRGISPSWEWITGYSIEELTSRPFIEFVHPDDREGTIRETAGIVEGAVTIDFENRYVCKDGSIRWLYWTAVPDLEEGLIYAVARDMTQRKKWEKELERTKEEAEMASRAKSDFLASMSHELRTPLNSVIGFANVLLADKKNRLHNKQKSYLERIRSNGEHLLELINEVLDLSRIEAGRVEVSYEKVDLKGLIVDVLLQFDPQVADVPTELVPDLPEGEALLATDSRLLRQVLINLVSNAIKFTPNGTVTARLAVAEDGTPTEIEIADTGIGIPEDKLEVIFESFEQVDCGPARTFQGTGLGLAICRSLCGLLGYQLTVESELGRGSVFRIGLVEPDIEDVKPAPSDSQAISREMVEQIESAEEEDVSFAEKLVLVIDDDPDSRLILTQSLHELGCQVLTATSARQGMRLAQAHTPDLITLDLLMPDTNGWQVLARFKEDAKLRHIPVVVVSSAASEYRESVIGAAEVLDKPVEAAVLKRALERNLPIDRGRVLVVDDSSDDRELLTSYLSEGDTEVRTAASGNEALEVLDTFVPDLVIVDLLMPGMDGAELIEELRRRDGLREVPVLIVTAKDLDRGELERLSRASSAVVLKGPKLQGDLNEICWKLWRLQAGSNDSVVEESA
jgi:PAS domain S-box-containing protein